MEADVAKNRLLELKAHEENRQREAMRARQIGEMLGIEEAHMLEFQQFNSGWDSKMEEYEQNAEGYVELLLVSSFLIYTVVSISMELLFT